jgi:predicted MFS family arabinose efflux permease
VLTLKSITIAPSIGPILGGGLTYAAGWAWIFWFLCILAGSCLATMILFLPETSRNVVGNGSIRPQKHLRLPVPIIMRHWKDSDAIPTYKWRLPNPLKSLMILVQKDNAIVILACGLLYIIYTCLAASLSTLFVGIYTMNELDAGLIYLPFGIGGVVSTFISGRLLDRAWHNARVEQGLSTDRAVGDDLDNFPVEKARLRVIWTPLVVTTCSVISYGWVLQYHKVCLLQMP